jgi:hypothetical protein
MILQPRRGPFFASAVAAIVGTTAGVAMAQSQSVVFPQNPHVTNNAFPFNQVGQTYHQVFISSLFADLYSGAPVRIESIGFGPGSTTTFDADVAVRFGYTNAAPLGLLVPVEGGGGAPNAIGSMHTMFQGNSQQSVTASSTVFNLRFEGSSFDYDPSQGNLLMEIVVTNRIAGTSASRADGGAQSSRAWQTHGGSGGTDFVGLRTEFTVSPAGGGGCYPNCDGSTIEPILNVADFSCFLGKFAAGDPYANCDGSTIEPVLNVADFSCFLGKFAAGCR